MASQGGRYLRGCLSIGGTSPRLTVTNVFYAGEDRGLMCHFIVEVPPWMSRVSSSQLSDNWRWAEAIRSRNRSLAIAKWRQPRKRHEFVSRRQAMSAEPQPRSSTMKAINRDAAMSKSEENVRTLKRAALREAVYASCPNLSRAEARKMLNDFFEALSEALARGEPVKLRSFGHFKVCLKRERTWAQSQDRSGGSYYCAQGFDLQGVARACGPDQRRGDYRGGSVIMSMRLCAPCARCRAWQGPRPMSVVYPTRLEASRFRRRNDVY